MASIRTLIAALSYVIALCGIAPLFPWLTMAPKLAIAAGMTAGILQDRRGSWPIKSWVYNAAIIPVFLYYALQYSRANPIEPVVSVLAIMLAVRLGGEKNNRYYLQIQALSLFCLAASSLFDLSPAFLIYLAIMLLMVAVTLVLLTFYSHDSTMTLPRADLRRIVVAGLFMPLASLPLLAVFFPILPRTQLPLWNFLAPPVTHTSGMSDKVEPGRSANIGETPALAFRAEMPREPQANLYWRGTVFNKIIGNRWVRDDMVPHEQTDLAGPRLPQTIYPEPSLSRTLIALDAPAVLHLPRARRAPDNTYLLSHPAANRLSYQAESVTSGTMSIGGHINRNFYLQLPDEVPPSIHHLADEIRRRGRSDSDRVELLVQYFRSGNYRYSLRDLPTGAHALEQFLFTRKQGHCEFFASSFALVLRAAGVPARLVGGYLGGEYNEMGGYYLVTEDRAHVWVEAFMTAKGWVRIDPSSFAVNAGAYWGGAPTPSIFKRMQLLLDSLDYTWNRAVITYDFESQVAAVRSVGKKLRKFEPGAAFKAVRSVLLPVAVGVIVVIILALREKLRWPSREQRLLNRFYRRLEHDCGITADQSRQGLYELVELCKNENVKEFVDVYAATVYRDRTFTTEEFSRLKGILKRGFRKT